MTSTAGHTVVQLLQDFQQAQGHRAELYSRLHSGFKEYLSHGQEAVFARLLQELTPAFNEVSKQVIQLEGHLRSTAVGRDDLAGLLRQVQELERNKLRLTLSWQALRAAHAAGRFSWQAEADRPTARGRQTDPQQQQQLHTMLQQLQLEQAATESNGSSCSKGNEKQQQQHLGQVEGFMSVKPGFYERQLQRAAAAAAVAQDQELMIDNTQQQDDHMHDDHEQHNDQHDSHQHQHHGCCGHHHDHDPDPLDSSEFEPTEAEYTAAVKEALQELDGCVLEINDVLDELRYAVMELQQEGEA